MALYDRMLRMGKRPYVHGAEDNHNHQPFGSPLCDSFGAWTMLLSEELSYPSVIRALEGGGFTPAPARPLPGCPSRGKGL